jgi:thiamine transport system ATP-binding protein
MLSIRNFTSVVGDFKLSGSLEIGAGQIVGILGPSGSGKSTLLSVIAGFQPLESGEITWVSQPIGGLAPAQRPMTILFQDNNLFPHLTAFQNIALGISPSLKLTAGNNDRVMGALDQTGLVDLRDRRPNELSGGQQSRVALARSLVRERPLLLLDEPFAALGPGLKSEMLELVRALTSANGTTVLMVTHDPADAKAICKTCIVVSENQVTGPFETGQLLANPPASLQAYLGNENAGH